MATYGSVTVQVPATEDYSASGRIAARTANSNGTTLSTSGGTGTAGNSVTITWVYSFDGANNDGFSGERWTYNPGPFSEYATSGDSTVTTAIQNGTIASVESAVNGWLQSAGNEEISQFIASLNGGCYDYNFN